MARYVSRFWKSIFVSLAVVLAFYLTVIREDRNGLQISLDSATMAQPRTGRPPPYDLSQLQIMNRVILLVKDNYIDRSRISPREMLLSGLDFVQRSVAEVLVEHEEDAPTLRLRVDRAERTFRVDDVDSPWALSYRFKEVFRFIQENIRDEDVDLRDVEYAAINGMLHTLDPHSVLLTPDIYEEMRLATRGEFGGLGIVISIRDQQLTIISPIDDTPASRAGLRAYDRIVRINDESTINMRLDEAVNLLRGPPGTSVTIWIERRGWLEARRFDLVRAIIRVDSIDKRVLDGNIGYIKIKNFQGNTFDDLERAIAELRTANVRGLVLDLRNNPGGLLEQAVQVSDVFLRSGTIVTTAGNDREERDEKTAQDDGTEPTWPMIVLTNGGSASASEIVAGALQNHDRALVMGERTFGKGSVQVLYDFDGGSALKLTIAQYLTPGDVSIQSVGIVPDVEVQPMIVHRDQLDLEPQSEFVRESDLRRSLTNDAALAGSESQERVRYLDEYEEPNEEPDDEDEFELDFTIALARDALQRARANDRRALLAETRAFLHQRGAEEQAKAERELARLGVDWSTGPDDGPADLDVQVTTGRRNETVRAGDELKVRATVTNRGPGTVYRLEATSKSDNPYFDDREFAFGRLRPGESRSWEVPVKIRKDSRTRLDQVQLTFVEANGHVPPPAEVRVRVEELPRPVFAYGVHLDDTARGNGDGRLQRGELITLHTTIRNQGAGPSFDTQANIRNLSRDGVLLKAGRFPLGAIRVGETKRAAFTFEVSPEFSGDEVRIELSITDTELREFEAEKLRFRLADGARGPRAVRFVGKVPQRAEVREEPSPEGRLVGHLAAGSVVRVTGSGGGFVRVDLGGERPGFVVESQVVRGGGTPAPRFSEAFQNLPPRVEINDGSVLVTRSERIRLQGVATDEQRVRDLYVFVGNRKVFYRSNRGSNEPGRMAFDLEVPLQLGSNSLVIVARESEDLVTRRIRFVRRDNPDGTGAFTPRTPAEEMTE